MSESKNFDILIKERGQLEQALREAQRALNDVQDAADEAMSKLNEFEEKHGLEDT